MTGEIELVIANNDDMALGAIDAFENLASEAGGLAGGWSELTELMWGLCRRGIRRDGGNRLQRQGRAGTGNARSSTRSPLGIR